MKVDREEERRVISGHLSLCDSEEKVGGAVARTLASHHGYPGSIPGGFISGFSHVGIVVDDAACGWVSPALAFQRRSILGSHLMPCTGIVCTYGSQLESVRIPWIGACSERFGFCTQAHSLPRQCWCDSSGVPPRCRDISSRRSMPAWFKLSSWRAVCTHTSRIPGDWRMTCRPMRKGRKASLTNFANIFLKVSATREVPRGTGSGSLTTVGWDPSGNPASKVKKLGSDTGDTNTLQRSTKQAPGIGHLGWRHTEKIRLPPLSTTLISASHGLISWLVEEVPAYRNLAMRAPIAATAVKCDGAFRQEYHLRLAHVIVTSCYKFAIAPKEENKLLEQRVVSQRISAREKENFRRVSEMLRGTCVQRLYLAAIEERDACSMILALTIRVCQRCVENSTNQISHKEECKCTGHRCLAVYNTPLQYSAHVTQTHHCNTALMSPRHTAAIQRSCHPDTPLQYSASCHPDAPLQYSASCHPDAPLQYSAHAAIVVKHMCFMSLRHTAAIQRSCHSVAPLQYSTHAAIVVKHMCFMSLRRTPAIQHSCGDCSETYVLHVTQPHRCNTALMSLRRTAAIQRSCHPDTPLQYSASCHPDAPLQYSTHAAIVVKHMCFMSLRRTPAIQHSCGDCSETYVLHVTQSHRCNTALMRRL
ncbi:hypothetical protein PR048_014113 [Dryococelus australis]|uniref:Uncharacterized protein n=1 Tax=Dryococelus australis TaxID=614101 RepID=A0ABQ9HDF3_9NEOP|nr:hypothetical protein PR048_014113 [Dryococelus australis]